MGINLEFSGIDLDKSEMKWYNIAKIMLNGTERAVNGLNGMNGSGKKKMASPNRQMFRIVLAVLFMTLLVFAGTGWCSVFILRSYHSVKAQKVNLDFRHGDFYYNTLEDRLQALYNDAVNMCSSHIDVGDILSYTYTEEEYQRVMEAVRSDCPNLFWLDYRRTEMICGKDKSRLHLRYLCSRTETRHMEQVLDGRLQSVADALTAEAGEDKAALAQAAHDWLVRNCRAAQDRESSYSSTVYGALVLGEASAEGYAAAYKLLLNRLGIYCLMLYGRVYTDDHVWNLVFLNGKYYHVDVMWDDPDLDYLPNLVSHAYYCLSDKQIEEERVIGRKSVLPAAESSRDYYRLAGTAWTADTLEAGLTEAVGGMLANGETELQFSADCPDEEVKAVLDRVLESLGTPSDSQLLRLSENRHVYLLRLYAAE